LEKKCAGEMMHIRAHEARKTILYHISSSVPYQAQAQGSQQLQQHLDRHPSKNSSSFRSRISKDPASSLLDLADQPSAPRALCEALAPKQTVEKPNQKKNGARLQHLLVYGSKVGVSGG
jgi:hypothetical protein